MLMWITNLQMGGSPVTAVVDDEEKKIGMLMMQNTRRSMNRYNNGKRR